jgi:hypothetical protein
MLEQHSRVSTLRCMLLEGVKVRNDLHSGSAN